eukprot:gene1291-1630_t
MSDNNIQVSTTETTNIIEDKPASVDEKESSTLTTTTTTTTTTPTPTTSTVQLNELEVKNLLWKLESLESRIIRSIDVPALELLTSIDVCPRCCLRFFDLRELALYQEPYSTLQHMIKFVSFNDMKKKKKLQLEEEALKQQQSNDTTPTTTTAPDTVMTDSSSTVETTAETTTTATATDTPVTSTESTTVAETTTNNTVETEVDKKYNPNEVRLDDFVCCACLGMLQDTNDPTFLEPFIKRMAGCGYEFRDYSLALSLPTSSLVREYSIWYYLKQNFPDNAKFKAARPLTNIVDIKEGIKWILGPIVNRRLSYSFKHSSDFRANMNYEHEETKDDHQFLLNIKSNKSRNNNKKSQAKRQKVQTNDSNTSVSEMLDNISAKEFAAKGTVPPAKLKTKYSYQLDFEHAHVYLSGKYNKYVRNLSQTPWINEDIKDSIEDYICKDIKTTFKCSGYTFTSSGREDVDVRMLGNGRPFFIEIVDPHKIFLKYDDFRLMEKNINDSTEKIKVSNLQIITKKQTNLIKDAEGSKQKDYRCVVWTSKPLQPQDLEILTNTKNIDIKQITPVRVLHRRSLMTRSKKVKELSFQYVSPHFFVLDVIGAQAGTYIKEFVHGDLGRTVPSIGSILNCEADILQLDVLNVDLDFPPTPKK